MLGHLAADHRDCVLLVLAEVLNNVAEHAYGGAVGPVLVTVRQGGDGVLARIIDRGGAAPPLEQDGGPDPAGLPEGGFGLGLIRGLARDICQLRRFGCNVLDLTVGADNSR